MIEVLHHLITDLPYLEIILAPLLHLTTEVQAQLTIIQVRLADLITTIHHLTVLLVDQIQVTQEEAALVHRAEAQVADLPESALQEAPEEEGGINSPLFFV